MDSHSKLFCMVFQLPEAGQHNIYLACLILNYSQICDGVFDCPDLSDECLCQATKASHICKSTCFKLDDKEKCPCPLGSVPCIIKNEDKNTERHNEKWKASFINTTWSQDITQCINRSQFCNGIVDCQNEADELYCTQDRECPSPDQFELNPSDHTPDIHGGHYTARLHSEPCTANHICTRHQIDNHWTPKHAVACDGIPECYDMEDECIDSCTNRPTYCESRNYDGSYTCPEKGTLPGIEVCDGEKDCKRSGQDEKNCPRRFYCTSPGKVISVPEHRRCDHVSDCIDQSDELNCTNSHFYCESGSILYVPMKATFDGKEDCSDGSDECPSDFSGGSWFSSKDKLIDNTFLNIMIWVMAVFSIIGNLSVLAQKFREIRHDDYRLNNLSKIHNFLVMNLAVADLIMGVFLLILGIQTVLFNGKYCRLDKSWRSGRVCILLGIMATISSESSIAMLAILSSYRLYCIHSPFKSRDVTVKRAALYAAIAWIIAIAVAVIPILPSFSDHFVSHIWISPNPYFTSDVINRTTAQSFYSILNSYIPSTNIANSFAWEYFGDKFSKLHSNYEIFGYFGYYGTHAVCLPKIFVTTEDPAWEYSFVLMTLNFVLFVYIVVLYFLMSKPRLLRQKSTLPKKRGKSPAKNVQKRVALLVASDFACWVPCCMIAFLRLGGVNVSNTVYAFAAIILLPINSALNPVLYSNAVQGLINYVCHCLGCWREQISRGLSMSFHRTLGVENDEKIDDGLTTTTDLRKARNQSLDVKEALMHNLHVKENS